MMAYEYTKNPRHYFSEPIQRALVEIRSRRMDALARLHELAIEARPTQEERRQLRALHGEAFHVDIAAAKNLARRYHDRVVGLIRRTELVSFANHLTPVESVPEPRAADFWWAQTHSFGGGGISPEALPDGLHIFGRASYNGDALFPFSTGAWATFELQPERRPHSPLGRWHSSPQVELFGNLIGSTGAAHAFDFDDRWCKVFLLLRQSAIQFVDDVGTWRLCGERTAHCTLIDEENEGDVVVRRLPGFQPMPSLQFSLFRSDRSVLIDLEVRFDVQLEGESAVSFGSTAADSVLLRYYQWPCVAA